ncbi:MAG: hypothetical protein HF314_16325 [Ignavibacteria bacterium]|jgi:uncharacterized membrane protein|nr:hypothetical protein [Ignavibacteria bacterium]MCU7504649.1 hypothetical protein [Ignavibacteria bacterium]MCU7517543.1 hypothetical protein [Ignavibacteria bacterium]
MPFNKEEFLGVFEHYNKSVFPLQIAFVLLALVMVYLAYKNFRYSDTIINNSLAFYWIWIGIVYHICFFSAINRAAYLFGILFITQGLVFLYAGVLKKKLNYSAGKSLVAYFGWTFIAYALIFYPQRRTSGFLLPGLLDLC